MIRINIPGFKTSDSGGPRWGDAQIIDDGKNYLVIDGYCQIGTTRLVNRLKARKIKQPYLFLSHYHWDHYKGIRTIINDSYFSPKGFYLQDPDSIGDVCGEVKGEKATLRTVIKEARARKIPVHYLKNGSKVEIGDIRFNVYQQTERYRGNSDAYLNDGSLCFYFPDLLYWSSGDGPMEIGTMCEKYGCKPVLIKIPHHGNNCPRVQAKKLKELGTLYCWDNDISRTITGFLSTGREDCQAVGMKYFNCIGDLNMTAKEGHFTIYKGGHKAVYKIPYRGATTLHGADPEGVQAVLSGKYGNSEARTTAAIDNGYYPIALQNKVNVLVALATKIKAGEKYSADKVTKLIGAAYIPVLNTLLPKNKQIATEDKKVEEPKETTTVKLRDMSELFGIDVGYSQGKIDWGKVAPNIDFAILECGYGQDKESQDDKQYVRNAAECERLGIPYGIYLYSYAANTTRAAGEADHALRLAKGRQLSLPIYYDLEESRYGGAAAGNMSAFGLRIESAGYWCGLYAGEYYYNSHLHGINHYTKWIARYNTNNGKQGTKPNVSNVEIWQYSSRGKIPGINGYVDINVMYGDRPLKGVTGKDYIQAAKDVWSGKYGGGDERTKKLKEAGYDPRIVQHLVNRMIK